MGIEGPVLAVMYAVLGWLILRRLRLGLRGAEAFAWSVALGTGAASLYLFALVASGLLRSSADRGQSLAGLLWVAVPIAGLCLAELVGLFRRARAAPGAVSPPRPALGFDPWLLLPLLPFALYGFLSLREESAFDAVVYHLPAVKRFYADGIGPMLGCLDGEYRLGFDILWIPSAEMNGYAQGGPAAIHALAGGALAMAIFAEVRRRVGSAVAGAASTLFLVAPAVASIASTAYVDLGVGLYGFLALSAAARALRGEPGPNAILAGLFAGFAFNAKLTGALWIAVAATAIWIGLGARRGWKPALIATVVGLVTAAPWMIRAAVDMGNPFFPALAGTFGSGWADPAVLAASKQAALEQTGLFRGPFLGLAGTIHSVFDPVFGFRGMPWVVAFFPAALVRPDSPERRGLLAGGVLAFVAWGWFIPDVRFGLGIWAWGAVAAAAGAARLAKAIPLGPWALGAAALALLAVDVHALPSVVARPSVAASGWSEGIGYTAAVLARPVGVTGAVVSYVGDGAVSLYPSRNGILRSEDLDDPKRLLEGCRRLGLRSLLLRVDDPYEDGRRIAKTVAAWAAIGAATIEADPTDPRWEFVRFSGPP